MLRNLHTGRADGLTLLVRDFFFGNSTANVGRWSKPSTNSRSTCVASSTHWATPRRYCWRFASRPSATTYWPLSKACRAACIVKRKWIIAANLPDRSVRPTPHTAPNRPKPPQTAPHRRLRRRHLRLNCLGSAHAYKPASQVRSSLPRCCRNNGQPVRPDASKCCKTFGNKDHFEGVGFIPMWRARAESVAHQGWDLNDQARRLKTSDFNRQRRGTFPTIRMRQLHPASR